mgnify:FL=1
MAIKLSFLDNLMPQSCKLIKYYKNSDIYATLNQKNSNFAKIFTIKATNILISSQLNI